METELINTIAWHVPIAVGVLLIQENQVFLIKRTYKDWGFGAITGELNQGETLRQAAIRYVEKKTGVVIDEIDLKFLCFVHYKTEDEREAPLVFFFSAHTWMGEPFNKESNRHSEARWMNLDQLPDHLAPGEDLVFDVYKNIGTNPNVYLERGWNKIHPNPLG